MSCDDRRHADRGRRFAGFVGSPRSRQAHQEAEALRGRTRRTDRPASASSPIRPTAAVPIRTRHWHRSGSPRQLKYKVHQTIDGDSRVILDTQVTTGARHDNQPYLEQLHRVCDRYNITIHEAIADRGYGSATIIRTLQEQGTTTYIPLWSGRVGNGKYMTGGLSYEREHDRYRCPQGKYLHANRAQNGNYRAYSSSAADCCGCPLLSACPTEFRKRRLIRVTSAEASIKICSKKFSLACGILCSASASRNACGRWKDCSLRRSRITTYHVPSIAAE